MCRARPETGARLRAGHDGPVYSVCPHVKGNISFVFSTGRDGRIKAWLYDSQVAAVVDYSAPGAQPRPPLAASSMPLCLLYRAIHGPLTRRCVARIRKRVAAGANPQEGI